MRRSRKSTPRLFDVSVCGREAVIFTATSRGKALYEAFLCYSDLWTCTFREFLAVAKATARPAPPADDGYGYVRRAYGIDPTIGQRARLCNEGPSFNGREGVVVYPGASTAYVKLVLDGEERVSIVHPMNVELLPAASGAQS